MAQHNFKESMEKYKLVKDDKVSSLSQLRAMRGENLEETRKEL